MVLTLGVLAGEASGDNLGAGVMRALRERLGDHDEVRFVGVGGARMREQGLHALASIDELSVNGFRDPIVRLPQLIRLLRRLIREFSAANIDGFLGVDFNVFNFLLEAALKRRGIKTAHYVSPSVYAWRSGRTRRVAKSADLVLCLYPFEPAFYDALPVRAEFVGHPLADEIAPDAGAVAQRDAARDSLGLDKSANTVLAVLPGSRNSEVALMVDDFLRAAELFAQRHAPASVVVPCLRPAIRARVEQALEKHPNANVTLYDGDARRALIAADIALVKSGTSTLEAMLLHRPAVVSYRLGRMTYQLAKRVVRTPYVALPNILAGRELMPELLQDAASGPALADALDRELRNALESPTYIDEFCRLHEQLRCGADAKAAAAVLRLLQQFH